MGNESKSVRDTGSATKSQLPCTIAADLARLQPPGSPKALSCRLGSSLLRYDPQTPLGCSRGFMPQCQCGLWAMSDALNCCPFHS